MFDLKTYLDNARDTVNANLNLLLKIRNSASRIEEAMGYSLFADGKRLRPILCLAAAEAVGGIKEAVLDTACAIEMIHTYSLIHDDLPAMDNDELRRGKPTCHIAFDEATAVLAGDALLTFAFEILANRLKNEYASLDRLSQQLKVIKIISRAAGFQGMIQGQMLDIGAEGKTLSQKDLESMHLLKTGALINASIKAGSILGGGTEAEIDDLGRYAHNIGLAFQVVDDILNVEGNPEVLGKSVGTDSNRKKATYPAILGLERSKKLAGQLIDQALQSLSIFDNRSEPLRALAHYVIRRNR